MTSSGAGLRRVFSGRRGGRGGHPGTAPLARRRAFRSRYRRVCCPSTAGCSPFLEQRPRAFDAAQMQWHGSGSALVASKESPGARARSVLAADVRTGKCWCNSPLLQKSGEACSFGATAGSGYAGCECKRACAWCAAGHALPHRAPLQGTTRPAPPPLPPPPCRSQLASVAPAQSL